MRIPDRLSFSAFNMFETDREAYVLKYLVDDRPPREPQTRPMCVGSAFDAYVKAYLYNHIFGANNPEFEFPTLFETQVEEHNRDWALGAGAYAFGCYKETGALADLMKLLEISQSEPSFETKLESTLTYKGSSIPFIGYADIMFSTKQGTPMTFDWKINGFCGKKSAVSPKKGYVMIRGGRTSGKAHPKAQIQYVEGVPINTAIKFHEINPSWNDQLTIYGWLQKIAVGTPFIVGIEQGVCKPTGTDYPEMRFARFTGRIDPDEQERLWERLAFCWNSVAAGHPFNGKLSRAEGDIRFKTLQEYNQGLTGDTDEDIWFRENTRQQSKYFG